MSDDRTPDDLTSDDPFVDGLGAQLHAEAAGVDGADVTRSSVIAAAERRRDRRARTRAVVVGVAAAIALVGGLAVAASSGDHGSQQLTAGPPTTTDRVCADEAPPSDPAGWFRLTEEQAETLHDAGVITRAEADQRAEHAVLLTHGDLQVLTDPEVGPIGQQLFDLRYEDSAGLQYLRTRESLTTAQEEDIARGIAPVLLQVQVDRIFAGFPDLLAIAPGGQRFASSGGGVEFAPSTTVDRPAQPTGRGEASCPVDDGGDPGAPASTSTSTSTSTPGSPAPVTSAPAGTATSPATATTAAAGESSGSEGIWVVYLYVLSGRRNADGSITTADQRMDEVMAGDEAGEMARAASARRAAGDRPVFEGDLDCDIGAAVALGLDPLLGQLGISVAFTRQADADAFVRQVPSDVEPSAPVRVAFSCAGRPAPT